MWLAMVLFAVIPHYLSYKPLIMVNRWRTCCGYATRLIQNPNLIMKLRCSTAVNCATALETDLIDFKTVMKQFRHLKAHKKVLQHSLIKAESGLLTQNMTLIALKTMEVLGKVEQCPQLFDAWESSIIAHGLQPQLDASIAMVKFFASHGDMRRAEKIGELQGVLLLPSFSNDVSNRHMCTAQINDTSNDIALHWHGQLLSELALGYICEGSHSKSLACLVAMQHYNLPPPSADMSRKMLKQFMINAPMEAVRRCIRLLVDLSEDHTQGLSDNDFVQLITNAVLREIVFVTGAVSMETLPVPTCPEVCFIGRSNVGKSSLINMITNRKGLAYTSKKPGKTAEFNYFEATGVVGRDKEEHRFRLVDLPGVGYALKSRELRANWTSLLRSFVQHRSTLRVVFHLVDSRHGLLESDEECLALLETLPAHVQYVIVLTKVDKQRGAEKDCGVRGYVVEKIYHEIARRTLRVVPILFTSSETKYGAASLLATILDAVAPKAAVV